MCYRCIAAFRTPCINQNVSFSGVSLDILRACECMYARVGVRVPWTRFIVSMCVDPRLPCLRVSPRRVRGTRRPVRGEDAARPGSFPRDVRRRVSSRRLPGVRAIRGRSYGSMRHRLGLYLAERARARNGEEARSAPFLGARPVDAARMLREVARRANDKSNSKRNI